MKILQFLFRLIKSIFIADSSDKNESPPTPPPVGDMKVGQRERSPIEEVAWQDVATDVIKADKLVSYEGDDKTEVLAEDLPVPRPAVPEPVPVQPRAVDVLDLTSMYISHWTGFRQSRKDLLLWAEASLLPRGFRTPLAWVIALDIIAEHGMTHPGMSQTESALGLVHKQPLPSHISEATYMLDLAKRMNRHGSARGLHRIQMAQSNDPMFGDGLENIFPFLNLAGQAVTFPNVLHERYG